MSENQNNNPDDQDMAPFDEGGAEENADEDADIIELSDITIGIAPEDEKIIELTEEVIDESMSGITGATGDAVEKEGRMLDLSGEESRADLPFSEPAEALVEPASAQDSFFGSDEKAVADIEDQISEELDNYFGTEEDVTFEETVTGDIVSEEGRGEEKGVLSMPVAQVTELIEGMINKKFADKIDNIYVEVLKIAEEIRSLKARLTEGED